MNPLMLIVAAIAALFMFSGGRRRRRASSGKFVARRTTGKRGRSKAVSQRGSGRTRIVNGKTQYLDGNGRPYTPRNAPKWVRDKWLSKARSKRKSKK